MLDRTPHNPHQPQPAPLPPQVNLLIWRENNFSRVCTQCFKISWNPKDFIKWFILCQWLWFVTDTLSQLLDYQSKYKKFLAILFASPDPFLFTSRENSGQVPELLPARSTFLLIALSLSQPDFSPFTLSFPTIPSKQEVIGLWSWAVPNQELLILHFFF